MSKKIRYFIEPLDNGKIQGYVLKNNKNKKFLSEHPKVKELSQTEYEKSITLFQQIKLTNGNKDN